MQFIQEHLGWILLAISEALALSPIKGNSIVQIIISAIKSFAESQKPKA